MLATGSVILIDEEGVQFDLSEPIDFECSALRREFDELGTVCRRVFRVAEDYRNGSLVRAKRRPTGYQFGNQQVD
jgi:hypothetical protein